MAMRLPPMDNGDHASDFPPPHDEPGSRRSESPVDHALTLLLAGEIDAAMRWAAAVLERAPSPSALLVTCRLLDQMGRTRAAIEGLRFAVQQSVDRGNLPLAVAAIDDLRVLGADVGEHLDAVASAFSRGSSRLHRGGEGPPGLPSAPPSDFVRPLSPFLQGPALASKATQIVQDAKSKYEETLGADLPRIAPLPLFSALSKAALRDVVSTFRVVTVPAGHRVILEGDEGSEAYVVVRGEVEISRRAANGDNSFTLALARLGAGAFFGEMALLSLMPSPASATATRPSILLSAPRGALVDFAASRPEIAGQLAAHCRRNSLANLGWTSPVVAAVPPIERASLVERLEMHIHDKGDLLVQSGEESPGLHLIVSGEVAIVAKEWGERVLLATLGPGETVGEMELVLCRQPFADAVATRSTATLFLSRDEYSSLIQDHPAILHGLYAIAVQRQAETSFALKSGSAVVADDWLLDASGFDGGAEAARPAPEPQPVPVPLSPPVRPLSTIAPEPMGLVGAPAAFKTEPPRTPTRRTLPLPPPPPAPQTPSRRPSWAGSAGGPGVATGGTGTQPSPSSVSPTVASFRPSSLAPANDRGSWIAPATAAAFAAVAATVVTVLAFRSQSPATPITVSAARAPSAEMAIPPSTETAPAPAATATSVTSANVAPSTPTPAASPAASNATPRWKAATGTALALAPRRDVAPPEAPALPAKTVAASAASPAPAAARGTVARAETAATPQGTDDEFGGRQ